MKTSLLFIISTMISQSSCFPKREKVEKIEKVDRNLFKRFAKESEFNFEVGTVHQERTRNRGGRLVKRRKSGSEPEDSNNVEVELETGVHQERTRNRGGRLVKRRKSGSEPEDSNHVEVENYHHRRRRNRRGRNRNRDKDDNVTTSSQAVPTSTLQAVPTSTLQAVPTSTII